MNSIKTNNWKKVELGFPILTIVILVIYTLFFNHQVELTTKFILKAVVLTVLFNTTHIGFTFTTVFFLPEARKWQKERFGTESFFKLAFLLNCVFWVLLLSYAMGVFDKGIEPELGFYILTFAGLVSLWHNFAQTMGLSLVYNHRAIAENDEPEINKNKIRRSGLFEKRFIICYFLIKGLFLFFIKSKFDIFREKSVVNSLLTGELLLMSWFIYATSNWRQSTEKRLFSLRYLTWPFLGYVYLAPLVIQAVHGIEYLIVQNKMVHNSSITAGTRNKLKYANVFWLGSFFILGIFEKGSIGGLLVKNGMFNSYLLTTLSALSFGLFMVHVALDSVLYRFSNQITKNTIGKLILK